MKWVKENTSLPVPEVLAYQADRTSAIGFEWIAMTKMPGKPLADLWRDLSFPAKEQIVRQVALFCAETFRAQLRGIGNIFPDSPAPGHTSPCLRAAEGRSESEATVGAEVSADVESPLQDSRTKAAITARIASTPRVRRIVSASFILAGHAHEDVSLGPFKSSKDWLLARLALTEIDCRRRLSRVLKAAHNDDGKRVTAHEDTEDEQKVEESEEEEEEEDDPEELEQTMDIIARLRNRLDEFFPGEDPEPEPTMIVHDDLSRHNILVSEEGVLTAVVDWECVSALPLWFACQLPPFLQGKPLDQEPIKAMYRHDENGEVAKLYWEHLDNYELAQLRRLFLEEMQKLEPGWVDIYESSQRQGDFELAVAGCDDSFLIRRIRNWLSDMESGVENFQGLEERIDNGSL
ncbi:hypothetical protein VTK56DRAFT_5975 [Thermocarpiscus australiensis]